VLLDLDPVSARGRLDSADKPFDRLEAEKSEFHGRVREAYLTLAAAEPERFLVVDGAADVATVASRIRARVADLLG
jgi:dTMP kinase